MATGQWAGEQYVWKLYHKILLKKNIYSEQGGHSPVKLRLQDLIHHVVITVFPPRISKGWSGLRYQQKILFRFILILHITSLTLTEYWTLLVLANILCCTISLCIGIVRLSLHQYDCHKKLKYQFCLRPPLLASLCDVVKLLCVYGFIKHTELSLWANTGSPSHCVPVEQRNKCLSISLMCHRMTRRNYIIITLASKYHVLQLLMIRTRTVALQWFDNLIKN